jgi:predicted dehydrogenase
LSEDPIRIGIIGCGQIAQHHLSNYAKIPGANVVACADINPSAADSTAERFGIPNIYYTAWEMLKRDDLDAVDVCVHNNLHVSGTRAVLESGRHCYCEKPMAGTYHDAHTMLKTARETGKKLHIQLAFLYSNETRAAKELIDLGELGELYHGRSTGFRRRGRPFVDGYGSEQFVQKAVSGGGALYDMGVYHISRMLYLMGNPNIERISGKTYQKMAMDEKRAQQAGYSVEELGMGFVRFAGDMSLDIIESWAINLDNIEGSTLVGSKGGVRLEPFGFFKSVGDIDLDSTANMNEAWLRWTRVHGLSDIYDSSQAHWIAALQGKCDLLPTAEIALNTMLISQGIYLSQELGREVTAEEVKEMSVTKAIPL